MSITFTPNTDAPGRPEVNMANGRAETIFDLLGFDPEQMWNGDEIPAEDFLGRVLLAQALLDVTTDDEHGTPDVIDGPDVYCGTRPGYFEHRLLELQQLAEWAKREGAAVVWH